MIAIPEIIVKVSVRPDHLYAVLGNLIRLNPLLHILNGNERMLTMRLTKIDDLAKTEFHFGLVISFDGIFSSIHFSAANLDQQDKLKEAAVEVLQLFGAYDTADSVSKLDIPRPKNGAPSPL